MLKCLGASLGTEESWLYMDKRATAGTICNSEPWPLAARR